MTVAELIENCPHKQIRMLHGMYECRCVNCNAGLSYIYPVAMKYKNVGRNIWERQDDSQ